MMSATSLPSKPAGSIPFATFTTTVCMGGSGLAKETHALAPRQETAADRNQPLASLRGNPIIDPSSHPEGSMDVFVPPGAQQQHCEIVTSTLFHFFGSTPTPA